MAKGFKRFGLNKQARVPAPAPGSGVVKILNDAALSAIGMALAQAAGEVLVQDFGFTGDQLALFNARLLERVTEMEKQAQRLV